MNTLLIKPLEPIIARDGRPFGSGGANQMRCLDWLYPSVTAGTIRTLIGKKLNLNFHEKNALNTLKNISIYGPLPFTQSSHGDKILFFPAPGDILIYREEGRLSWMPLRPETLSDGEGCTIPRGLTPVGVHKDIKPEKPFVFWGKDNMVRWLAEKLDQNYSFPDSQGKDKLSPSGFIKSFDKDTRVHIKIDPITFAAEEQMLFVSQGLVFPPAIKMALFIDAHDEQVHSLLPELRDIHQIGADHRLAAFTACEEELWECPADMAAALKGAQKVRMILATPAIFSKGWLPGWINPENLEGTPPGIEEDKVRLRLTGACVERWKPLSGWSLEPLAETGKPGPKAIRRIATGGSVYFFEVINGDAECLDQLWMRPVSDNEQDCRDGFGLALWGIWK